MNTLWFLYIVECNDGTLYTGISKDVKKRVIKHNRGQGAKSLIAKRPVKLVYFEEHENHLSAARREFEIKGWKRVEKLKLINNSEPLAQW